MFEAFLFVATIILCIWFLKTVFRKRKKIKNDFLIACKDYEDFKLNLKQQLENFVEDVEKQPNNLKNFQSLFVILKEIQIKYIKLKLHYDYTLREYEKINRHCKIVVPLQLGYYESMKFSCKNQKGSQIDFSFNIFLNPYSYLNPYIASDEEIIKDNTLSTTIINLNTREEFIMNNLSDERILYSINKKYEIEKGEIIKNDNIQFKKQIGDCLSAVLKG